MAGTDLFRIPAIRIGTTGNKRAFCTQPDPYDGSTKWVRFGSKIKK
jgi:hypothetical protein